MEPFEVRILNNICEEDCMDPSIQLFYVIDGGVDLRVREKTWRMHGEDLILVNAMEPYSLKTADDGIVCVIIFDYGAASSFLSGAGAVFSLNSLEIFDRPYREIREICRELVYLELMNKTNSRCRNLSKLYELLDTLFYHCMDQTEIHPEGGAQKLTDHEKLHRILTFVNGHYPESFSLKELAASMYVSTSTLSRFFKKQTGYYFADYLKRVRLMHAVSEITGTSKSITRIAADCGFTNASTLSGVFHEEYGMSPQEYRKEAFRKKDEDRDDMREIREALARRMEKLRPGKRPVLQSSRQIVDIRTSRSSNQPWRKVLNMGSLSSLTRANVQYHLLNLVKELKMPYVKIWSVFAKDLRITDGKTIGSYNYSVIDTVLDVIVENQIRVYFDFGSRPDVIIGSMDSLILSEEEGITFTSRRAWETLFQDFIRHLIGRYGPEEIREWIFDFCIDPTFRGTGDYYQDPDYDYQNVFEFAFKTLRKMVPGTKVGGPSGLPNSPKHGLETFLKRCAKSGCVPDFVSFPLLPYIPSGDGDHFSQNPDPAYELSQLREVHDMVRCIFPQKIPIYVSDWNHSVSNRNVLNDSCMRGAYFCNKAHAIMEYAELCCIWFASDWISNYYDTRNILSGCGGLLSRDSIRKPAYYALQFLGRLDEQVLFADEQMIVTMKNHRSFTILCSNHVHLNVTYYLRPEEEITPESLDSVVVSETAKTIELELYGLDDGTEYIVKTRSVSKNYGSIQDELKRFGYESLLEREDVKYLREICVPHMSMSRAVVCGGRLHHRIILDEQEFQLIHIYQNAMDY